MTLDVFQSSPPSTISPMQVHTVNVNSLVFILIRVPIFDSMDIPASRSPNTRFSGIHP